MQTSVYVGVQACVCVWVYRRVCVCVCAGPVCGCAGVCVCAGMCVCVGGAGLCVGMQACVWVCVGVQACVCVSVQACVCAGLCVCVCVCVQACVCVCAYAALWPSLWIGWGVTLTGLMGAPVLFLYNHFKEVSSNNSDSQWGFQYLEKKMCEKFQAWGTVIIAEILFKGCFAW